MAKLFKGMTLSLSGGFPKDKPFYEELIQSRGGSISSCVTDKVDLLISTQEDVDAKTHKVALSLGRGIPILTQYWILDSVKAGKLLEQDGYVIHTAKKSVPTPTPTPPKKRVPTPVRAEEPAKKTKTAPVLKAELPVKTPTAKVAGATTVVPSPTDLVVVHGWDAELVLVDPTTSTDKFYNMQIKQNKKAKDLFYIHLNWGKTGLPGRTDIRGPYTLSECKKIFKAKFHQKTGNTVDAPFVEKDGMYMLLAMDAHEEEKKEEAETATAADKGVAASASGAHAGGRKPAARGTAAGEEKPSARRGNVAPGEAKPVLALGEAKPFRWQYYSRKGWNDYEAEAVATMEKYYKQFQRKGRLSKRFVQTSYFLYEIDFWELVQTNWKTGKRRAVRRLDDGAAPSDEPPKKIPEDTKPDPLHDAKMKEEDDDLEAEPQYEVAAEGEDEDKAAVEEEEEQADEPVAPSGRAASATASSSHSSAKGASFRGSRTAPSATSSPSAAEVGTGKVAKPARWEYYGKKEGWRNYEPVPAATIEKFYLQFKRDGRSAKRVIQTGYDRYEVDFAELDEVDFAVQTNPKTGKRRVLRRVAAGVAPSAEPPKKIPEDRKPNPLWNAKADEMGEDMECELELDSAAKAGGLDVDKAEDEEKEERTNKPAASSGRKAPTAASFSNSPPSIRTVPRGTSSSAAAAVGARSPPGRTIEASARPAVSSSASAAAVGTPSPPARSNTNASRRSAPY